MATATKSAARFGAIVSGCIALIPYLGDFLLLAFIDGAFAGVWFAVCRQRQLLSSKGAADLGFRSGFYGILAACAIYDIVWKILHYELWRVPNLDLVAALSAQALRDAVTPSIWFLITIQIIVTAICAGALGAPSGLLALKLFSRRAGK